MLSKIIPTLLLVLVLGLLIIWKLSLGSGSGSLTIRYIAVGDSYTYGQGAIGQDWPTLLTTDLHTYGIDIALVKNLGHDNWTSQQAIDGELPTYHSLHPTFATLLIGANDWIRDVTTDQFRQRVGYLMDQMLTDLPNKNRLIVLTIPDYSITPAGIGPGLGRNIPGTLIDFNQIIAAEAGARGVTVVDLYKISQQMGSDPTLISSDSLHPSAKEYAIWEKLIYPKAFEILKNTPQ